MGWKEAGDSIAPSPSIALSPPHTVAPSPINGLKGDLDGDEDIDLTDVALLKNWFGQNNLSADFNSNGTIDIFDFTWLLVRAGVSFLNQPNPTQAATLSPLPSGSTAAVKAFPEAEGFGAKAKGGRGGKVMEVTTLADGGLGSLRACIESSGPRICVFRVAGTIELMENFSIKNPFLTIAGQTAPGGGITVKNHPTNIDPTFKITTNDVVLRYFRVRPGPSDEPSSWLRALTIDDAKGHNIIIDHMSFSWSTDELLSTWYGPHDVTVQWSMLTEVLKESTHEKGEHGTGPMFGSEGSYNVSFHHNLLAHNDFRNPLIKTTGMAEVVNNVIYNWGFYAMHAEDDYGKVPINIIGNFFKKGSDSSNSAFEIYLEDEGGLGFDVYAFDNIGPRRTNRSMSQDTLVDPNGRKYLRNTPHPSVLSTVHTCDSNQSCDVYTKVLDQVGATQGIDGKGQWFMRRDSVDQRVVAEVKNGTGKAINHPSEVGGWPQLDPGVAYVDSDKDGMADEWEQL